MKLSMIIQKYRGLPSGLRRYGIPAAALSFLVFLFWMRSSGDSPGNSDILISPKKGDFIVSVTNTGELHAKNSIDIMGPEGARNVNIWQMKINSLIPEGTVVKAGDIVAELERGEIANKVKEGELSIQKFESQYTQAKLESTLTLSQSRDDLVNLFYAMEEKRILKDQSIYEPPALRRQAEIDFERSERSYKQASESYKIKVAQSIAKIKAVESDLMKERSRYESSIQVMKEFSIRAPAPGMVIYAREWNGKKRVVGSQVNAWDATVATLPDLTVMESITYINEVDVQKIKTGLDVKLSLDADPSKKLTGKVTYLANVGEQRPNSDSKVFEVKINVNESDTTLRPAMTTGNEIIVASLQNVVFVPIECVHTSEGISFVYKKDGSGVIRQQVTLGVMNESGVVITRGINEQDQLYISVPQNGKEAELVKLHE